MEQLPNCVVQNHGHITVGKIKVTVHHFSQEEIPHPNIHRIIKEFEEILKYAGRVYRTIIDSWSELILDA